MNMKRIKIILTVTLLYLTGIALGQDISKSDIELKWADSPNHGRIRVTAIKNKSAVDVRVLFINEYGNGTKCIDIKPEKERSDVDVTCNLVKAKAINGSNDYIQIYWKKKEEKKQEEKKEVVEPEKKDEDEKPLLLDRSQIVQKTTINANENKPAQINKKGPIGLEDIIPDFNNYLESIPDLSISYITEESSEIDKHIKSLRNWKDKDIYISENHLNKYIKTCNDSLSEFKKNLNSFVDDYFRKFDNQDVTNKEECLDSIQKILIDRLAQRDANIKRLADEINTPPEAVPFDWKNLDWKFVGICAGIFLLLVILLVWFKKANKKNRTTTLSNNDSSGTSDASSAIVVRRKTTSILRKQSLEDVIDNDAYLKLDCNDFCADSVVRRMYIKNTCIKDIYNMYAEDLRNPNNPKEDGCMVLGRWVHDDQSNEYYVSLEHIVLPGDDAVFSEYELNFGGKIKLKVTEKLRKLRRETNLQYDLTCWVHSHPGLGVFFSNSDSNVQMQLKHPTHPNFLTAIVVDILTPQQEMGIFTFKRDSSINSKADLKKLYSLEELYKWAVESDRNSFKPEDHYNTLTDAKSHQNDCYGIELSNGAIIDMGMLVAEKSSGLAGMVHGFSNQQGIKTEHVASTVSKNEAVPDNELIGCFVIATHCSIPSIRKVIATHIGKIKFVLVYTTTDGLLTSIPVVNQDICTDEKFYGEQKLEELKIWTRRKR